MEILDAAREAWPWLKIVVLAILAALVVISVAAAAYTAKTSLGPLMGVMNWMVGYTPGQPPGDIINGISYGARFLAWTAIVGFLVWCFLH